MTDLRITDEVDQAMVRDMESRLPGTPTMIPPLVVDTEWTSDIGEEVETPAPAPVVDEQTLKLLADLGFDHIPTADEVKARLDARREEVRDEVLFQADRKHWCDDGTRQVCANLRLKRPGNREPRNIRIRVTAEYTVQMVTFSDKGALYRAVADGLLPLKDWFVGQDLHEAEIHSVTLNGTPVDLTDALREEITNA